MNVERRAGSSQVEDARVDVQIRERHSASWHVIERGEWSQHWIRRSNGVVHWMVREGNRCMGLVCGKEHFTSVHG